MKAVVLLSGGLDSYTAAAIARAEGFELYALTIAYGQRHGVELHAARRIARALGVARHVEMPLDLSVFAGSSLTGGGDVPKDRDLNDRSIPSTYVPARNTVFLSLALAWAETIGAEDLVIGVNALDYSGAIIRRGLELGLDYGLTHSCYDPSPDGAPCGHCDSCVLRARGFAEAGMPDPVFARTGVRQGARMPTKDLS